MLSGTLVSVDRMMLKESRKDAVSLSEIESCLAALTLGCS